MVSQVQIFDKVRIFGYKPVKEGSKDKFYKVVLFNLTTGETTAGAKTDERGFFLFEIKVSYFAYGKYQVRFYGDKIIPENAPYGDWEIIEVVYSNPDGFETLNEYYAVKDATLINGVEGGDATSNFVKISWTDFKVQPESYYGVDGITVYSGADNSTATLTYRQSRLIDSYVVYMYVSETNVPPDPLYPGIGSDVWYFAGRFTKGEAEIRCPNGKYCALWIGFQSKDVLDSQIKFNLLNY